MTKANVEQYLSHSTWTSSRKNTLYSNFGPERALSKERPSQEPRAREWLDEVLATKRQKALEDEEPLKDSPQAGRSWISLCFFAVSPSMVGTRASHGIP